MFLDSVAQSRGKLVHASERLYPFLGAKQHADHGLMPVGGGGREGHGIPLLVAPVDSRQPAPARTRKPRTGASCGLSWHDSQIVETLLLFYRLPPGT